MKLKKCPFCRSLKNRLGVPLMPDGSKLRYVECYECGAIVSFKLSETVESTIEMYNNRPDER